MSRGRPFSLLTCFIAALAIAEASGQGGETPWPANVRVNQDDSGNPQAETSLAADPRDPLHLVAVWWEVTFFTPEEWHKSINYGWTRDGGRTWQSRRLDTGDLKISIPSVVADRQGNFYMETILVPDPFTTSSTTGWKIGIFNRDSNPRRAV